MAKYIIENTNEFVDDLTNTTWNVGTEKTTTTEQILKYVNTRILRVNLLKILLTDDKP